MKFLLGIMIVLVVLIINFIRQFILYRKKAALLVNKVTGNDDVYHPAEYKIR